MIAVLIFIGVIRTMIAAIMVIGRVFGALFFSPIFGRNDNQIRVKIVREYSGGGRQAVPSVAPRAAAAQQRVRYELDEQSRNQRDCAMGLKQLGIPPRKAEEIANQVAAALGRDAPLNDMLKRALQLVDKGR